ncbi:putative disease resistance RPP13-like protein 1 [Morella rubra]|uniref:Putative disease resistance RPP13-like protein 1 n=1 Tax=Morella rubra TaxID=262757 RepID=A0A6A1WMM6_9ROSI|nr:putative disease resistance RPP13-like protein 1 [Morella rubra]
MALGEVFLSAFLQVLFDRLASREFIGLIRGRKYHDLLEKLKITLLTVTALLNDAEEKQFHSPVVEKWLHMAKDALYDAEDILDELTTEALKCKADAGSQVNPNQVWNWNPMPNPSGIGIESKLKMAIEKLELIAKYKDVLGLKDSTGGRSSGLGQRLPTTSLVDESCVFGRGLDRDLIIDQLLRDEPRIDKIGVIPIVGMGGIGKTTLAQVVYNDHRVEEHFDLRIWVCVSEQFDVVRVTKTILRSVNLKDTDLADLNLLQVSLKQNLAGRRFLLVLDDVWNKRNNDWELLWNPLKTGARGSKILVTTRNRDVASSMGTVPAHHLRSLSFDDCWLLFTSQAFENRNIAVYPNLKVIGLEIVEKCEGLPLAAKRLGILLRSRQEEDEWKDILNRKICDLPDDESEILQSLRLSYHHLPAHLKQCFAYCSIFPKGYEFDKDSLVLLWMAEGFVQQPKAKKRLEEVGGKYFLELLSRSFFQESIENNSRFVMHGILRDLADIVSGEFCFRLEDKQKDGNQNRNFERARHSSYIRGRRDVLSKFEAFNGVERLRTFLPVDPTGMIGASYLANKVPSDLLPRLRYLRALSFNACRITELPDSIGDLKHLRYLDLSHTAIKTLPDSIGTLYNLQTLLLWQCNSLSKLPAEMGNLTNLRHLCISGSRLKEMPQKICRLKNLQTLSIFMVGKDGGLGIRDLKDMCQLQGSLLISGLQNIVSFTDAMDADLKDKQGLDQLILQWSNSLEDSIIDMAEEEAKRDLSTSGYSGTRFSIVGEAINTYQKEPSKRTLVWNNSLDCSRNETVETDVLEMLQPHKNIRQIIIRDYGGTKFPSWIGSSWFSNLNLLSISDCRTCSYLPPLGQLPSLKDLMIKGMEGIKRIGKEFYGDGCSSAMPFPSLETLKFDNMVQWEEWSSSGVEGGGDFSNLQEIEVFNCPKLRKFSHHFPALKKMSIKGCEELETLPEPFKVDNSLEKGREFPCLLELSLWTCSNLRELPQFFPSLAMLEINGCRELAELPRLPSILELEVNKFDEGMLRSIVKLTSLTYLRMYELSGLTCLPEGFLQSLTALEELQIAHLGELNTLSTEIGLQNLQCLQRLEISGCPFLEELPAVLHELPSLSELRILNCPLLISFPATGLPSTLIGLEIKDCEALQLLPEWKMHNNEKGLLLEYLVIEGCSSLTSLPRGQLPSTLKKLEIHNCMNLESLPEQMQSNTCLEFFKISCCHSIMSFSEGTFGLSRVTSSTAMRLKELVINGCTSLESLPGGLLNLVYLDYLEIVECPILLSFPEPGLPTKLRSIRISNCRSLKSLPNRIYSLTSLEELRIDGCPSLASFPEGGLPVNLLSLSVLDSENLKPSYEWGLHRLTGLLDLTFGGCQGLVSFPEKWLLPSSLSSLHLERLPNLESLPNGLKSLTALDNLEIWECDRLQALPDSSNTMKFGILGMSFDL